MKMRRLLNVAMPFMHESAEAAIVMDRELVAGTTSTGHRKALYGLPCARCGVYYDAKQAICPVCSSKERVRPKPKSAEWPASVPRSEAVDVPLEENLGLLATVNWELLAKHV